MPEEALELSALRPAVWVVFVVVVSVVLDPSLAVLTITSTLVETGGGVVVAAAALLLSPPAEVLLLPLSVLLSSSLPLLDVVLDGGGVVVEPEASAAGVAELELAVVEPAGVDAGVELLSPPLALEDGASEVGADDGEEAELDGSSAADWECAGVEDGLEAAVLLEFESSAPAELDESPPVRPERGLSSRRIKPRW